MDDRDKLWTSTYAIIEGLGNKFGMWKGSAERIAYKNIYNTEGNGLSDEEVRRVVADLKAIINC